MCGSCDCAQSRVNNYKMKCRDKIYDEIKQTTYMWLIFVVLEIFIENKSTIA